jgi:hypothetical protein
MVHSAKPHQVPQELVAEGCFQPGKILFRTSASGLVLELSLLTQKAPGLLTVTPFDAAANKVAAFGHES